MLQQSESVGGVFANKPYLYQMKSNAMLFDYLFLDIFTLVTVLGKWLIEIISSSEGGYNRDPAFSPC